MAFTSFAASKGKYVHPYFCLQKDHIASNQGFSIREDDDYVQHDLPSRYVPSLEMWGQEIHQAISHKNVFPVGICDKQITIVNTHACGHGYLSLLSFNWTTQSIITIPPPITVLHLDNRSWSHWDPSFIATLIISNYACY